MSRVALRRLLADRALTEEVATRLSPELRETAQRAAAGSYVTPEERSDLRQVLSIYSRSRRPGFHEVLRWLDPEPKRWRLLEELVAARYATAAQLTHLVYLTEGTPPTGNQVVGRWLRRLWEWGIISSFTPTKYGLIGGSAPLIYVPERAAAKLVAGRYGAKLSDLWKDDIPALAMHLVPHRLAILDAQIGLRHGLAAIGGEMVEWQVERRYDVGRVELAPDAIAVIRRAPGEPETLYFVEVDLGTEGPSQFLRRMSAYNAAAASDDWKERYGTNGANWPIVLVIVAGTRKRPGERATDPERRVLALKKAVEEASTSWGFPRFKFVAATDVYTVPDLRLTRLPSGNEAPRLAQVTADVTRPVALILRKPDQERRPVF